MWLRDYGFPEPFLRLTGVDLVFLGRKNRGLTGVKQGINRGGFEYE